MAWPAEQRQRRRGREPLSWCVETVLEGTSGKVCAHENVRSRGILARILDQEIVVI